MAKACWMCGKENAECSFETESWLNDDELTEIISTRNKLRADAIYKKHQSASRRMFCPECFAKMKAEHSRDKKEYLHYKKKLMLERAVRSLEKQALDIYLYKDIIADLWDYIQEQPEKFDSSYEMMAAIILIENEIKCKMQFKVGKYRVDFLIPEYKIALEIDGDMHENTLYKDNNRDIELRRILGADWETVRIGTKYLDQNAKALPDAMFAVKEEKQKLRARNNGFLPDWYSKREFSKRKKKPKIGDELLLE